ncbi:uncharacterized protein LOC133732383 [Rosa rugosa]|uniref:uncharacterized protein LOC133732383 n=1 Tax=Rosa rugosa TaxID=74645 RepID=UPI002B41507E|nr:uncharacterized protein LOC133732383 [Rosa rugosa]XP_062015908.1 uncharacterized protein LOC133732383 [Rosa rugosa]XP_062015909.1 uncharacterized protein LOC133732383 [Rosa rugosa]XP_062015910.1 uncharacterized protein LOC133732383 [Rosa rugosa]
MLSAEKLPPDPPCPPPKLIKDVDLSKQTLIDDNSNNPLPKFSIRDYVFTARSKDLKTNWPFSQKNLQRCMRHGVKDVLPPFQSLDSVRNQPPKIRCTVEDENRSNLDIAAPSGHVDHDHAVLDSSNNAELKETGVAEACTDTTTISCRSEGENDFPSTITSVSQSEIEESVPINRPSRLPIETDTSLEAASVEVKAAGPPTVANKTGRTTRPPPGKKCRLVVKYNSHSERNSKEDIASNCSTISETMTSKVCPVCKTFSSSSNTTLNAHIDQCLSGESTPKWTVEESKVTTRHRIKPRKTKLMVDIYDTAQHCTLEDLDRRNGSSWATTISSFPTNQDKENSEQMPAEEKRQRVSSVYPEPEDIDVGAVYVDASGTKVRILSKFDDVPSPPASKVVEHLRPIKHLKGGKGTKFLSAKKKKHHKYLKLAPQSRNLFSPKAHSSEFHEDEESYGVKESCKEGRQQLEKQVNPYNPLALRPWACSKRTGVGKKLHRKDDHQAVKSKWHISPNFLVERDQTCMPVEGNCVRNFSGNPISSPERSASTENDFCDSHSSDKSDCSPQRKRAGSPLSEAGMSDNIERSLKRNSRQFSNHSNFAHDGDYEPMFSNTAVGTAASPAESYGSPVDASAKPSKGHGASRSNSMKFPSSKKIASSIGGQLSLTENDAAFVKKCSAVKKSQVHERSEIDKEAVDWDSEGDQGYDFMYNCAGKQSRRGDNTNEASPRRSTVLQMRRNRGSISYSGRRETMASESSQLAPEHSGYDERKEMDTSGTGSDEFVAKIDCFGLTQKEDQIPGDVIITESSSLIGVGETVTRFCNPVDPELNVLGRHSKAKSSCFQYKGSLSETKALTSPTDPRINNEKDMFCADEVEDGTVGHSAEEMDSEVGQGSYFTEVDPIPIPGPPGSFLPSPRDMGSDDFQANSSLTTSRVQSSQDQLDFVDGDTSDSPISTTSTISHSTGTNQDRKFCEPLSSKGSQSVQEKIRSGMSSGAASDASVETNAAALQQITGNLAERLTFDRENFRVNKISLEKGPLGFKSKDDQPCCCQRKERNSQGLALNYQESPLLRRRAMASVIPATMGKQMGCSPNTRTNNAEMRSDTTDMFSLNGCPTSRPEQVSIPVAKSPSVPVPLKGSPNGKGKFSSHSDSGSSVSPSASNSILRLMGKNLMVVNRDEDASPVPPGQAQPHAQMNHLTSQFPTFSSGVSPGSFQNQVYPSFHHNLAHGSVILGQDPYNKMGECFDVMPSKSFRSYINPKMPPVLARGPPSLFPKQQHTDGGFLASMESKEYKGDYHFPIPLQKSASKPTGASTFHKNANSASSGNKEIIVIDDLDCEADHLNAVNYSDRLRESQAASSGILIPAASSYNSKRLNPPLSCYQSPEQPSLLCGSPVLYNTSFHAIPSRRANASPVTWNCTTDGSGVLQRSPFHATSTPSRGLHMRSTLYNPPSLS